MTVEQTKEQQVLAAAGKTLRRILDQSRKFDSLFDIKTSPVNIERARARTVRAIAESVSRISTTGNPTKESATGRPVLSPGRWQTIKSYLERYVKFVGDGREIEDANRSEALTRYHAHLLDLVEKKTIGSTTTAKDCMQIAR